MWHYQPSRSDKDLRDRADWLVGQLELPDGADLEMIVGRVADLTGRRIDVEPVGDRDWETVTGLLLIDDTRARILSRRSDPRWYQFHTVLHELAHLLWGHPGCGTLPWRHAGMKHVGNARAVLARGVVTRDFERSIDYGNLDAVVEAEAEKLAQLLSAIVLATPQARDEAVFGA
ncbi:hypothetical protein ACIPY5_19960 [Microbacterium sp. NPDC089698]|uniref:hypothetical protein n=1 Tax=Microbacterium sp. NPDC089698 TaxID=3364200 RepID=UPI003820E343